MTLRDKNDALSIIAQAKDVIEQAKMPIRRATLSGDSCRNMLEGLDKAHTELNEVIKWLALERYTDT